MQLSELAGQVWNSKDARKNAANLVRMIEQSNRLAVWVATAILKQPKLRLRTKAMINMITLMEVRQPAPRVVVPPRARATNGMARGLRCPCATCNAVRPSARCKTTTR